MAALAVDSRSANENCYRTLRAEFDCAYKEMTDSSREFSAILMNTPAGLSAEERRERKDQAAQVYDDAQARFRVAVRKLNEFMIGRIVSSRSAIQLAPTRR
jgi:hypothetical protein